MGDANFIALTQSFTPQRLVYDSLCVVKVAESSDDWMIGAPMLEETS